MSSSDYEIYRAANAAEDARNLAEETLRVSKAAAEQAKNDAIARHHAEERNRRVVNEKMEEMQDQQNKVLTSTKIQEAIASIPFIRQELERTCGDIIGARTKLGRWLRDVDVLPDDVEALLDTALNPLDPWSAKHWLIPAVAAEWARRSRPAADVEKLEKYVHTAHPSVAREWFFLTSVLRGDEAAMKAGFAAMVENMAFSESNSKQYVDALPARCITHAAQGKFGSDYTYAATQAVNRLLTLGSEASDQRPWPEATLTAELLGRPERAGQAESLFRQKFGQAGLALKATVLHQLATSEQLSKFVPMAEAGLDRLDEIDPKPAETADRGWQREWAKSELVDLSMIAFGQEWELQSKLAFSESLFSTGSENQANAAMHAKRKIMGGGRISLVDFLISLLTTPIAAEVKNAIAPIIARNIYAFAVDSRATKHDESIARVNEIELRLRQAWFYDTTSLRYDKNQDGANILAEPEPEGGSAMEALRAPIIALAKGPTKLKVLLVLSIVLGLGYLIGPTTAVLGGVFAIIFVQKKFMWFADRAKLENVTRKGEALDKLREDTIASALDLRDRTVALHERLTSPSTR